MALRLARAGAGTAQLRMQQQMNDKRSTNDHHYVTGMQAMCIYYSKGASEHHGRPTDFNHYQNR
jgi:hypothetical protein